MDSQVQHDGKRHATTLSERVAALEQKMRKAQPAPVSGKPTLASEIDELERKLKAMSYMDEGLDGTCSGMDEEIDEAVEFPEDLSDEDFVDEDSLGDDEAFAAGPKFGSETKPGVEDRISQDYLSEVEKVAHGEELATDDSMLAVSPTKHVASEEYVARLHRASERLDKVATYLEKQGRVQLAAKIDKISDAIDARAQQASRRV